MTTTAWRLHAGLRGGSGTLGRGTLLLGLFLLGFVPRAVLVLTHRATLESWEYEALAQNIVSGQGYVIMHFGQLSFAFGDGNLYSFLAGAVYRLVGHHPSLLALVQALLAALIGPLLYAVAARPLGRPVATLGAVLGALHPGLLAYTLKLHPLGLDTVLLAALVLWIRRIGPAWRDGLEAGLALGLNLMSRPTFFVAGLAALAVRWRRQRAGGRAVVVAVALASLIALPWVGRNWAVLGQPLFMSTSLEEVWKGNNPDATGSGLLPNGKDVFSAAPSRLQVRFATLDEVNRNAFFGEEVVEFAREQPVAFAGLVAHKFLYFWWASPQTGLLYPPEWLDAYLVYAAVVLGLAAVGAVAIVRGGDPDARDLLWTIGSLSLGIATLHALAYVEGRHRWGIEPLLLVLTAQGAVTLAGRLGRVRLARQ
jgi:hypothetical protein